MIDTLRVLVEEGDVDPSETTQPEFNYETAISQFNLKADENAVEALEYLLQQTEISQIEDLQWSSCMLSPDLTVVGQGLVISRLTTLACLSRDPLHMEFVFCPLTLNMMRSCLIGAPSSEESNLWRQNVFFNNLTRLMNAKPDHLRGFDYWTVLRLLKNPWYGLIEDVKTRIDECMHMWLLWLEQCGIDNSTYLEEDHDFDSVHAAYPFVLEHGGLEKKEGKLFWRVPEMIERFSFYDFTKVDLNESHTRGYRAMCEFRHSNQ